MKKHTKERIAKIGGAGLALFLLGSATLSILAGRLNYRNYFGGVVFAPLAGAVAIILLILLFRSVKRKAKMKTEEELFEGPLKDWEKW